MADGDAGGGIWGKAARAAGKDDGGRKTEDGDMIKIILATIIGFLEGLLQAAATAIGADAPKEE